MITALDALEVPPVLSNLNGFKRKAKMIVVLTAILALSSPLLVFQASADSPGLVFGAIQIKADGSVQGTDKIQRVGNVYTLTADINVQLNDNLWGLTPCIVVLKDNVVIDGAGHAIQSNGTGMGIYARGVQDVTIQNFRMHGFVLGISSFVAEPGAPPEILYKKTANNRIVNNDIELVGVSNPMQSDLAGWGIYVEFAEDIQVTGNTIKTSYSSKGLFVGSTCNRTTISDNHFFGCGLDLLNLASKTISGNTIDGKSVVYLNGASNQIVENAEQVLLYNSDKITVQNIDPNNIYRRTIQLEKIVDSTITNCRGIIGLTECSNNDIYGNLATNIALFQSSHNKVYNNTVSGGYVIYPRAGSEFTDGRRCIDLSGSSYNEIFCNILKDSNQGVHLGEVEEGSSHNSIYQNNIFNVGQGVLISYSPENQIYSNLVTNSTVGISIQVAEKITTYQNNITRCNTAVSITGSNNQVYHNNFIDNTHQVAIYDQMLFTSSIVLAYSVNNTFDAGVLGGNFWSTFNGVDSNGDGISETPYTIDRNGTDNYPYVQPLNFGFEVPQTTPYTQPPASSPQATPSLPAQETAQASTPATVATEYSAWIILPIIVVFSLIVLGVKKRKRKHGF